ncbi:type II toxin-antitoxin system HicA family toxin [Polymorphospora rubra]|uniref:type II toxin-antitoxin system HicA family toxin n=1 Tax=Polymorphospora rubra TaxID=338584 RepID=UPI001BB3F7DF|nr:type II toxin-antitoxin system HicA family toxin [Polymorphospora rubra]
MKRVDLIRAIARAARRSGVGFDLVREGGSHSIFRYGSQNVVIPRHSEVNELTARAILRDLDIK